VAVNELFPGFDFSVENVHKIGKNMGDESRVMLITIYTRERLFTIRNKRRKHDEKMEDYEEYLYSLEWIESWRSYDVVMEFKRMLLEDGDSLSLGKSQFQKFVHYVKRYIVWCNTEPQFDMIFAVAPRIRRKIQECVRLSLEQDNYSSWLDIEFEIYKFYQGKGW
jgi:hypothetical protein